MKKILLAGAVLATTFASNAQMTLQHTYTGTTFLQVVNLQLSGKKYCDPSVFSGQIRLYNLNHTVWKTINAPTIPGWTLNTSYPASYVTENLFKLDNKVDIALNYTLSTSSTITKTVIIDETGAIINTVDSTEGVTVYNVGVDSFVAVFQGNGVANFSKVYSLPGTIPCNICGNGPGLGMPVNPGGGGTLSGVNPNPNNGIARINYTMPSGTNKGYINIYNTTGQKVNTYIVDRAFNYITVDNSMLPSGTYYYQLVVDGVPSSAKQMVIIK